MSNAVACLIKSIAILLFFARCQLGTAQSIEEILAKCRASVEILSSYEYSAISTSYLGEKRRLFFARDVESFRYDQQIDLPNEPKPNLAGELHPFKLNWNWDTKEFRVGFDGIYFYEDNDRSEVERTFSAPAYKGEVVEPFCQCFCWLTTSNYRSEILKKTRWDKFAKSSEGSVTSQQVEGHSCAVLTSRPTLEGWRYEVAFANELGHLPVRVRRLVGEDKRIVAEWTFTSFKRFNTEAATSFFPTEFYLKAETKGSPVWYVTKIKPGTLRNNMSVDAELIRLEHDSAGYVLMNNDGLDQKWFQHK